MEVCGCVRVIGSGMSARPSSEFLTIHSSLNPLAVEAALQFLTSVFPHIISFKTGINHIKHTHSEKIHDIFKTFAYIQTVRQWLLNRTQSAH